MIKKVEARQKTEKDISMEDLGALYQCTGKGFKKWHDDLKDGSTGLSTEGIRDGKEEQLQD